MALSAAVWQLSDLARTVTDWQPRRMAAVLATNSSAVIKTVAQHRRNRLPCMRQYRSASSQKQHGLGTNAIMSRMMSLPFTDEMRCHCRTSIFPFNPFLSPVLRIAAGDVLCSADVRCLFHHNLRAVSTLVSEISVDICRKDASL